MAIATANMTITTHLPLVPGVSRASMTGYVSPRRMGVQHTVEVLLICMCGLLPAADSKSSILTLTGSWTGKWTDSREGYNGSGGSFTCVAMEDGDGKWHAEFSIGKTRTYKVELKGKVEDAKLVFSGAVDLGGREGLYTWKGSVTSDVFTGEYDGPGEKGTFKMRRWSP